MELVKKISLLDISRCFAMVAALFLPLSTAVSNIFFIAAAVTCFLSPERYLVVSFIKENRVAQLFLLLFLMFMLGLTYTTADAREAFNILGKYNKFFFAIFLFPLFTEMRWRKWVVQAFLAGMVFTLFLSYLKYFGVVSINMQYGPASVFRNHITTNFMMAIAAYLFAFQAMGKSRWRWLFVSIVALMTIDILFLSQGRSGYFVFFALMMLFFFQRLHLRGVMYAIGIGILLVMAALMWSNSFKDRIYAIASDISRYQQGEVYTSIGLRTSFMLNSLALVKAHPILGTGTGSLKNEYAKLVPDQKLQTRNPHNEYLNITVQLGSIGLIFLLFFFYLPWRDSYLLQDDARYLAQGIILSVVVGCLANSLLMDSGEGHLYVLFMAVAFACLKKSTKLESSVANGAVVK